MKGQVKFFWSIKNSGEVINKLKLRRFHATSLSTYNFSTLYTTLPHNLIKEKLNDLIEYSFEREGLPNVTKYVSAKLGSFRLTQCIATE